MVPAGKAPSGTNLRRRKDLGLGVINPGGRRKIKDPAATACSQTGAQGTPLKKTCSKKVLGKGCLWMASMAEGLFPACDKNHGTSL
jgi:hypothetical protein